MQYTILRAATEQRVGHVVPAEQSHQHGDHSQRSQQLARADYKFLEIFVRQVMLPSENIYTRERGQCDKLGFPVSQRDCC